MSHANKRAKTDSTSTVAVAPLFSDIDISNVVISAQVQGTEIKFATINYNNERMSFQLVDAKESLRVPFGIDDGARFSGGKPSLRLELPPAQLEFMDQFESKVKESAIEHKKEWFGAIEPIPTDDEVKQAFTSRVCNTKNFPPNLKVNVNLGPDHFKKVRVSSTQRSANGKLAQPNEGSPDQVDSTSRVVPVLRTAGGVWIRVKAKKSEFEYGLSFEASDLLVVEENVKHGAGINLCGVLESFSEEEDEDTVS